MLFAPIGSEATCGQWLANSSAHEGPHRAGATSIRATRSRRRRRHKGGKNGDKGKGGKSKGRGKLVQRYMQPVEGGNFKHSPAAQRDGLGSWQRTEYLFEVSIRVLKAEHMVEAGAADQMMMNQKKRNNDEETGSRAKRTPTPLRQQAYTGQSEHLQDPWATARQMQHGTATPPLQPSATSSQPSQPSAAATGSELAFGTRISA